MRRIVTNMALVLCSILTGIFLVNTFLLLYVRSFNQKNAFPRAFLNYISVPARWSYPDYSSGKSSKKVLLVGDSYMEGAGDSFVNNDYEYSIGHLLSKTTNFKYYLAASGGSFLSHQLEILDSVLQGEHAPMVKKIDVGKTNLNIIMSFYEGNDLDDHYYYFKKNNANVDSNNIKGDLKHKFLRPFARRFLPIYFLARNIYKNSNRGLNVNTLQNDDFRNKICFEEDCKFVPRLQAASPDLTQDQIVRTIVSTSVAINKFKQKYDANVCLVYIPSPATIYSPNTIHYAFTGAELPNTEYNTSAIENMERSVMIRNLLRMSTDQYSIKFIDSTQFLTKATKNDFIHGERDHNHFNKNGYELLSLFIQKNLEACLPNLFDDSSL